MFGFNLSGDLPPALQIPQNQSKTASRSRGKLRKGFFSDDSGHVAVMFGIFLIPIISAVGMSVDYSSAISAKSKIQTALDSAALAAGRMLQTSGSESAAKAAAEKHFASTIDSSIGATLSVDGISKSGGTINLSGTANVPTQFMRVVGFDTIKVSSATQAELAIGGGDKAIEVSMMLDVTGSMSGRKLSDMKLAAKDLVQILLQSNEVTPDMTKIALVPFSESVNVRDYAEEVASAAAATTVFRDNRGRNRTWRVAKACITERTGGDAFTDATPNGRNKVGRLYTSNGTCKPVNDLIPLSTNQRSLNRAIDSFTATGYTAGHLGTAWAWYTLSPNWRTVWPRRSRPAPYDPEKTNKIAILLTDGEYNTQYYNGVMTRYLRRGTQSPNGSSDTQADKLCVNMKKTGITIYTIGFQLDSRTARATLKGCATSDEHYFLAEDGYKLREVFRQIAFQIAQLRLSK